jgi:hypothetical protein
MPNRNEIKTRAKLHEYKISKQTSQGIQKKDERRQQLAKKNRTKTK